MLPPNSLLFLMASVAASCRSARPTAASAHNRRQRTAHLPAMVRCITSRRRYLHSIKQTSKALTLSGVGMLKSNSRRPPSRRGRTGRPKATVESAVLSAPPEPEMPAARPRHSPKHITHMCGRVVCAVRKLTVLRGGCAWAVVRQVTVLPAVGPEPCPCPI